MLAQLRRVALRFPFGASKSPAWEEGRGAKAVMGLWAQMSHKNARMTNPDCVLEADCSASRAEVTVEYLNGESQTIDAHNKTVTELLKAIDARSQEMETAKFLKESELLKDGRGLTATRGDKANIAKREA